MPYLKNSGVCRCPSDPDPTASPDSNGNDTIIRSYIANTAAEDLLLAQVDDVVDTVVVTGKWGILSTGAVNTSSWMGASDGEMSPDPLRPGSMTGVSNWHQSGTNCAFFDGHAHWETPAQIWSSRDLSGCTLFHYWPTTVLCDETFPGCTSAAPANLCDTPSFFPYPAQRQAAPRCKPNSRHCPERWGRHACNFRCGAVSQGDRR